ncbi:MAG: permease [Alphaproteobacteria bacterium]|nr:permease [Alphaproteobacteria bacterium]
MNDDSSNEEKRNLSILRGQGTLNTMAWTLANPSVVISYLAISLDLPVILAGLLVTLRQAACLTTALFGTPIAARRLRKKVDLAATDVIVALCFFVALASAAFGTSLMVTLAFIGAILIVGLAGEYQSIVNTDLYGDMLRSDSRDRLFYSVMTFGGAGTAAVALLSHQYFHDSPPFTRHAAMVSIGIVLFFSASAMVLLVRELSASVPEAKAAVANPAARFSIGSRIREVIENFKLLIEMHWFRKYLVVRIALLTVEMSIPFYAILAALSHHGSPRGLTALVVSTALALCVAGPLWQSVGHLSTRAVMIAGAMMAAAAGLILFANHFLEIVSAPYIHAVALFVVSVAVRGVTTARSLYFMDVAPKQYRVISLGASKVIVRILGVGLSMILATVAHLQHVAWAILIIALINAAAAILAFRVSALSETSGNA